MNTKSLLLSVLWLALLSAASAQDTQPPQAKPEDIARLIKQLDADDFDRREQATEALIKLGEQIEETLKKAAAESKSIEVKQRAERVLAAIERERLQRNALKLDTIYLLAKAICEEKAKASDLDPMIDKILGEISTATKGEIIRVPVRAANCTLRPGGGIEANSLYVGDPANVQPVRNSVAVFDVGGQCSSVQNSIIVAWGVVDISSCSNSIIIAGADVSIATCRNSVVLAGGRIDVSSSCQKTVLGCGESLRVAFPREGCVIVNTKFEPPAVPAGLPAPVEVEVPGLVLRDQPLMERVLDDKMQLTYLSNAFMLFRLPGQPGEYVVRTDNELLDPQGKPLPGLEGWKVLRLSPRFAILKNDEERTFLRLPRPGE
jgi:hypothetical protein